MKAIIKLMTITVALSSLTASANCKLLDKKGVMTNSMAKQLGYDLVTEASAADYQLKSFKGCRRLSVEGFDGVCGFEVEIQTVAGEQVVHSDVELINWWGLATGSKNQKGQDDLDIAQENVMAKLPTCLYL